ncbi:MAG: hypothetical protein QJR13_08125 [Bacillota bacterium]|nr:hypothetical protein [Bacillota bacterium]
METRGERFRWALRRSPGWPPRWRAEETPGGTPGWGQAVVALAALAACLAAAYLGMAAWEAVSGPGVAVAWPSETPPPLPETPSLPEEPQAGGGEATWKPKDPARGGEVALKPKKPPCPPVRIFTPRSLEEYRPLSEGRLFGGMGGEGGGAASGDGWAEEGFRLRGILYSRSSPCALLEDVEMGEVLVVRPGDSIKGARVLAIEPDQVVLAVGASRVRLRMPGV